MKSETEERPMRTKRLFSLASALALLMTAGSASAHHAFSAEFDANAPVRLTGTVTKMEWINPHSWIHIDVINEEGDVEAWMVEGGAPNAILRRGFTADSLKAGTVILVEGYQALRPEGAHKIPPYGDGSRPHRLCGAFARGIIGGGSDVRQLARR